MFLRYVTLSFYRILISYHKSDLHLGNAWGRWAVWKSPSYKRYLWWWYSKENLLIFRIRRDEYLQCELVLIKFLWCRIMCRLKMCMMWHRKESHVLDNWMKGRRLIHLLCRKSWKLKPPLMTRMRYALLLHLVGVEHIIYKIINMQSHYRFKHCYAYRKFGSWKLHLRIPNWLAISKVLQPKLLFLLATNSFSLFQVLQTLTEHMEDLKRGL